MGKTVGKRTEEQKDYDVVLKCPSALLRMFYDCTRLSGKDFCLKYDFPLKSAKRIYKFGTGVSDETKYPNGHVEIETRMKDGALHSDFHIFVNFDENCSDNFWSSDFDFVDGHEKVLETSGTVFDFGGVKLYCYTLRLLPEHEVLDLNETVSVAESQEKVRDKEFCRNKLETIRRKLLEIDESLQSVKEEYDDIIGMVGNSVSDRKSRCMVEICERVLRAELDVRFAGEWLKDMMNCVEQDD